MTQSPIGSLSVRRMKNADPGFYECMGPFFGSRKAAKEIGLPMFDDEDKQWFVAFDTGMAIGCASVRGSLISDCYVIEYFRRNGVFSEILSALLDGTNGGMTANCTDASRGAFVKAGFHPISSTKNYTRMVLNRA